MPGPGNIYHVKIIFFYDTVKVYINKIQSGSGSPMTQQPGLYVLRSERGPEQGIIIKIDLPYRQVLQCAVR